MKKLQSLIFISLFGLSACGTNNEITEIQQPQNVVQNFSASKNPADDLIKKMVDKRFSFADKNKDKKLVFNEFKGLESEHEDVMKKMFDEVDADKNGTVTYDEFVKADTAGIKSTLKQMFGMYDQNRNSSLDGAELDMVVEVATETANDSGNKINAAQVKKDFLSYDADKNGKLSFDEYQSPEMKYILMAPVDPYKNSTKNVNPVSINRFVNATKAALK